MERRVWLLALGVVSATLPVGTGGFSAAQVERPVAVDVSPDDRAVLAMHDPGAGSQGPPPRAIASAGLAGERPVHGRETVPLLAVHNRLPERVTVRATAAGAGVTVHAVEAERIPAGGVGAVRGTVDCEGRTGPVTLGLDLSVRGGADGIAADARRSVTAICAGPSATATPSPTTTDTAIGP